MNYKELQAKARQLRETGKLPKKFRLNQKTEILREAINAVENKQTKTPTQKQAITQDDFNTKLIEVYLEEKRYQEWEKAVVVIPTSRIKELLIENGIDNITFENLFYKAPGVFKTRENDIEIIQLELEKTENGKYQLVKNTTGNLVA